MQDGENIRKTETLNIDMIGFIFYPKSPRYIYEMPDYMPVHARRVGVFVNEPRQTIEMFADRFGLNFIQLHGHESPEYCHSLQSNGFKLIKTFSISCIKDLHSVYDYENTATIFFSIQNANNTAVRAINSTGAFYMPIMAMSLFCLVAVSIHIVRRPFVNSIIPA